MKKFYFFFAALLLVVSMSAFAQKTWTGATSTAWNTSTNWNPTGVPLASDNVTIPSGTTNSPLVSGTTVGVCNNLTVNSGATLSITGTSGSSTSLTVGGTATFNGALTIGGNINGNTGKLIAGNVVWNSSSSITAYYGGRMEVSGNYTFASGSSINLGLCWLTFTGGANSFIYNHSASSSFSNLTLSKTGSAVVYIDNSSAATMTIDGILTINSGSVFIGQPNITTILKGNLVNSGNIYLNSGTLSLEKASGTQDIQINTNDYINSLRINTGGTVTLTTTYYLQLKGSMTIQAGVLNPQNNMIALWGDWTNNVGTAGFEEGIGKVNFNGGNYHQYCSNETFFTLEVQKTIGGALRINGTNVTCSKYDWTAGAIDVLNNGTFTVSNQLLDNGIAGNFYLNAGCTINLTNLTGNVDLKGNLYIYGGNFNVYGGINPSWWPSGGNASITMSGGTLDFVDQSIVVKTDATYSFTQNITGGTIRTAKNFSNGRADFTPTAGTIELYGSTESFLLMTTGNLYSLRIDKTAGTTVNVDANATINGTTTINSGTLRANNKVVTTAENIIINNGGVLWMDLNSQLKIGASKTLTVNSGGTFRAVGTFNNEAVITRSGSSGYYVINISSGGTVAAKYASFYYVDPLRVYSGATIEEANPFSYCKFRYTQFGMLRIDNSQNLLIRNAEFLQPATGYNVYKSVNSGTLEFKDAYGDYSGSAYENDPYNRINWTVSQPGLWTGAVSTSWYNTDNWDDFTVPIAGTNVTIPSAAPNMPVLEAGDWQCNSLTVNGTITLAGANLTANGNLTVNGVIAMNNASSQFTVVGDVAWNSGSTANITANGLILVNGHWNFNTGSNAQLNNGRVYFQGSASKWIRCYSAASNFYSVYVTKTGGAQIGFSDLSTQPMVIKGELRIFANGKFVSDGYEDVILHGNLTCDGTLQCNVGAFKLDGATQSLKPNTTDYFNHLVFSQTGTASINTTNTAIVKINGNLHIDSGVFNAGSSTIQVGGDWDNNVGPAAFTEGSSRVVFNGGNYHQYINQDEDFATLEINKLTGGALRVTNNSVVTAATYDWTAGALDMLSGSFTATTLLDDGIAGSFYINSGTTVTLGSASSFYHLKGNLYVYGGTLNIISNIENQWPGNGNASITMNGGVINVYPSGIEIVNNPPYTFTTNITGGTIRTEGSFINHRSDFNPAGGTVELYGSNNTNITMNAGSLRGLTINKPSDKTVTVATNATVNGILTVQSGTLHVNNKVLTTGNDINVNNGGTLWMDVNSQMKIADLKFLTVNTGGLLKTIGTAGNEVVFTINGSGYYFIYIIGTGTISARRTTFYYVNPINVGGSAFIDPTNPFDYCKFRYCATKMLSVLNGQELTIRNVEFLTPAAGINVSKPNDLGSLTFRDAYGDFSGPGFENDPHNRIHWTYTQPGLWTGAVSSNWYTGDNWDDGLVPNAGTNVVIPASAPYMPVLDAGNWECNNLTINGTLTFAGANLTANGNMTVNGTLAMNSAADQLTILGDVAWESGSQANITADAIIQVHGHWNFNSGAIAQIDNGSVIFKGNQNKWIRSYSDQCYFNNIYIQKTGGAFTGDSDLSTTFLRIYGDFKLWPGSQFTSDSPFGILLKGDMTNDGTIVINYGGLYSMGHDQVFKPNINDFYKSIGFYQSGVVSINKTHTNILNTGNVTIHSGVFDASNCILRVKYLWCNYAGTQAFIETGSRVIFSAPIGYANVILKSENFEILEVDNISTNLQIHNNADVYCSSYDWTSWGIEVIEGSFTAQALFDNAIKGEFVANSGTTINLGSYGGFTQLEGNLHIIGGTVNIPAAINSQWPGNGNASITMSDGELNVYPSGIEIVNNPPYTFTTNITGGTIRTEGSFINHRSDFNPAGGTVELYGSNNTNITMNAGSLRGLIINKSSDKTVTLATNATVNGILTVQSGTLRVNNKVVTTSENIAINNGGTLWMDLNSQLKIAASKALTVNDGGWLKAIGSEGNECVITRNGASGYYYIDVFGGGSIAAQRASFYYVNPLRVYANAIIDTPNSFRYCKFRYCSVGMLRIDNNQDLVLRNVEFLTPAAGYNVGKFVNSGSVSLKDSYGDYSGATYESDTYNRIHWSASQPGLWTGIVSNDWLNPNNWDNLALPDVTTSVVIPAAAPNMPVLNSDAAILINDMTVLGTLTIGEANLITNFDCSISGSLVMNPGMSAQATIQVLGNLTFESGSSASLIGNSDIETHKNLVFNAGSNVQVLAGRVILNGSLISQVINRSSFTFIEQLVVDKYDNYYARFSDASTQHLNVNYLELWNGSFLTAGDKHFVLKKDLDNSGGHISCTGGTFKLDGINQSLKIRPDDYFHHLVFSQTGTASLNTINTTVLKVKGDLHIDSGVFDATGLTIEIAGNWGNNVGPASFTEASSRVIFNGGNYHQLMLNDETFDTLEVDKPMGGALRIPNGFTLTCNVYDWTAGAIDVITGGKFTALGLADDAIKGNYYINPDCEINLYPGEGKYDLSGNFFIYGGNFNVYGGEYYWSNWNDCSLTMSGGVLDFKDVQALYIAGDFNGSISGGIIRTTAWFMASSGFNPTGGFVEIYGSKFFNSISVYPENSLYNLLINRTGLSHFKGEIKNDLIIQSGNLDVHEDEYLICGNSINVYGGFILDKGSTLFMEDNATLNAYDGSFISFKGEQNSEVIVKSNSGYYSINAYSGSDLHVKWAKFYNLMDQGFYIAPGTSVYSWQTFESCHFYDGKTNTNALITIDNNEDIVIKNAVFGENTTGVLHNVAKTVDAGSVTFVGATGAFAGPLYENDPYNRIHWTTGMNYVYAQVYLEGPFNGSDMNALLQVTDGFPLSQPYNTAPWNYNGTETVTSVPVDVVDWILIEFRDAPTAAQATAATTFKRMAAFVKKNGSIVGLDGVSMPEFDHTLNHQLFLVVMHRNHLGIMSSSSLVPAGDTYNYDFTTGTGKAHGGTMGYKLHSSGNAVMVAGDANADGAVSPVDKTNHWAPQAGKKGYLQTDFNMDNQVDNTDKNNYWYPNFMAGYYSQVPD